MALRSMTRIVKFSSVSLALFAISILVVPDAAVANSDSEYRAELRECRQLANPTQKDDCVSNARNRFGRGNGAKTGGTDDGSSTTDESGDTGDRGDD